MDAKSLRVGNIFSLHSHKGGYCGDIYLKAESIVIAQNDIEHFKETYLPYKLTEEWLVDLGWMGDDKRFDWLQQLDCYDIVCGKTHYLKGSNNYGKPIEYVHELQNLCYSLTSKELIINGKSKREFLK